MQIDNSLFFAQIEALLEEGLEAEFTLRGNSMRPLLRNGRNTVIIAPTTDNDPLVGEVYLFRYHGRHTLHRLHRIEGSTLVMRGDGNYRLEERCKREDLVGRLIRVRQKSGRIIECSSPSWRLKSRLWCALPALVRRIILGIMRRIIGF